MRRVLLLGVLLLVGCRDIVGPFDSRKPERVDDPRYTISEQERRARDRLALPTNSGPATGMESTPDSSGYYRNAPSGPNYSQ